MPEIRYFNERGRIEWAAYIDAVRLSANEENCDHLLEDGKLTIVVPGADIGNTVFRTKFELAEALFQVVNHIEVKNLSLELWPGLWDWLAALHLDSICPVVGGGRKLRDSSRYCYNSAWNRKYRHRIAGPVGLFSRLGSFSKILIHGDPSSLTDWEEQTASRYQIAANRGMAEALCKLYWDEERQAPKRGAAPNSMKPGSLRRFGALIQQLDRTYDLLSTDANGMLELLPKEFLRYKKSGNSSN